jgi:adenine-specific DNA-methyltransferase
LDSLCNLTVKKIPKAVLDKCEWGKDDYSLEIKNLPPATNQEPESAAALPPSSRRRRNRSDARQQQLFAEEAE